MRMLAVFAAKEDQNRHGDDHLDQDAFTPAQRLAQLGG